MRRAVPARLRLRKKMRTKSAKLKKNAYIALAKFVFTMIRLYELSEARNCNSVLVCRIQRFPHDVTAVIRYYFADDSYRFKFPSSYSSNQVAFEVAHFVELVNSPHWRAEIQPNVRYLDDTHNYDNDILPF